MASAPSYNSGRLATSTNETVSVYTVTLLKAVITWDTGNSTSVPLTGYLVVHLLMSIATNRIAPHGMAGIRPGVVVFAAHHGHYWVHLHAHGEPERMGRYIVSAFQRMHLALLQKCCGSEELDSGLSETCPLLCTCAEDDTRWDEDTRGEQHALNTVL